jgi:molybdenum cofactor biosynthesis enzyme MoaA
MIDPFGRTITYLRVSVTDRCDFRCVYCMAEEMTFLPKSELLTLEELDRVCSAFVRLGVRKLRLTGGEPLVRRGIMTLFRSLGRHLGTGALDELTLTTNGSQLARYAGELRECGVRRVNVSVDTLDPAKFTEITRRGRLEVVLEGLAAAKAAGLAVKINAVALRGVNEEELDDLVAWTGEDGFDLVFKRICSLGPAASRDVSKSRFAKDFKLVSDTVRSQTIPAILGFSVPDYTGIAQASRASVALILRREGLIRKPGPTSDRAADRRPKMFIHALASGMTSPTLGCLPSTV